MTRMVALSQSAQPVAADEPEVRPTAASPGASPTPLQGEGEPGLLQSLLDAPQRYSFDAAILLMMQASGQAQAGDAARFHVPAGLAFPAAEILAVEQKQGLFAATLSPIGLTGPSGVLPRPYSDMVIAEQRKRSPALSAFLDMMAQRPIALFAEAGIKYRPHRAAAVAAIGKAPVTRDPVQAVLMALCGYGTPGLLPRLDVESETIAYFAGHFATHPRSVARLQTILADWLGESVEIEQFAGMWLPLAEAERTALPRSQPHGRVAPHFNQLGVDAAAGARVWDVQSRIVLRVGPMPLTRFQSFLPPGRLLNQLVALTRAFLGLEIAFAVNPVLAKDAVPPLAMTGLAAPRLGWDTWLPTHGARKDDATEAVFEADFVEQMVH